MTDENTLSCFARTKTLVLKLGSAVLTTGPGEIDMTTLTGICAEVANAMNAGRKVVVVSSGAVAAGRGALNYTKRKPTISEKQALAAVGQSRLMQIYSDIFAKHGMIVGQMLLTRGDMEDRRRYVNARYTLEELLRRGCVPIINENDTVTIDELKFGDNDGLAALVAVKMQADSLLLLSDVDGLYDSNPKTNKNAKLLQVVEKVTPSLIEQLCPPEHTSTISSGGMKSKLLAARLATSQGVCVAIAQGKKPGKLTRILEGNFVGTYFPAVAPHYSRKRQWILTGKTSGRRILVDDGARTALLLNKKSLLPAGIKNVEGRFDQGDVVEVSDARGVLLGRGVVNYSSLELDRIKGHKSADIETLLGYKPYDEAIHRDNLALLEI